MRRGAAILGFVCAMSGCMLDGARTNRPARLQLGVRGRHFNRPVADTPTKSFRTTSPTEPAVATEERKAFLGTAQFTMATRSHLYFGGEVEAGTLDTPGSNAAGAYGIAGVEASSHFGAVAAELTAGWRTTRTSITDGDTSSFPVEPRVRADMWLGPQTTLGAVAGATLGDTGGWMAGVFLAVHSHDFGIWQ